MFIQKKLILTIFILSLLFFSQPFLAQAYIGVAPGNPDPNVKFSDSWFVYTLKVGQSKEDAIIINNHSEEIVTVRIFPVEAALNAQNTFYTDAERKVEQGISRWVSLSRSEIELGPGESQKVSFTVKVPDKIEPKQYLGAVMAEEIKVVKPGEAVTEENNVGQSFNIRSSVGVRMYLTVKPSVHWIAYLIIILFLLILAGFIFYYFYYLKKQKKHWWQRIFKR